VGPRAGLDDVERRKILPLPELKLRPLGQWETVAVECDVIKPGKECGGKGQFQLSHCCLPSATHSWFFTTRSFTTYEATNVDTIVARIWEAKTRTEFLEGRLTSSGFCVTNKEV
jgi:hypothetical protein